MLHYTLFVMNQSAIAQLTAPILNASHHRNKLRVDREEAAMVESVLEQFHLPPLG